ncbi:NAD(P)-binding protein [Hesseltinella vesiculosa]|uniref:NAD(P)-binding protein n=1 Tax=Hesseltinella vesiculosa TaxID=101127 RepID=A0A1X2GCM0_9FUNG|nr:NAD(P)-binding protein [Hesseltinella vesiculosa]
MSTERVFVVGGTGNVGKQVVKELVANKVPVTLFARNPDKVKDMFGASDLVSVVSGDYGDLAPVKQGILGHTRLFLLCSFGDSMVATKGTIAQYAFDAGVKQVVDISGTAVASAWRSNPLGYMHYLAEKRLVEELPRPKGVHVVTLRPGRFMSNTITHDRPYGNVLRDIVASDHGQAWISPDDIGGLAALILQDDISKHGDAVYELVGDVVTPEQRCALFEKVIGQPVTYQRVTPTENFATLQQQLGNFMPFSIILQIATSVDDHAAVSLGLPILLGRQPESLEEFLTKNKVAFQ